MRGPRPLTDEEAERFHTRVEAARFAATRRRSSTRACTEHFDACVKASDEAKAIAAASKVQRLEKEERTAAQLRAFDEGRTQAAAEFVKVMKQLEGKRLYLGSPV